jgi:periplasmic protein TonB
MLEDTMLQQSMFADAMLETSWAQRSRRSLTTITSFGLEAVVIGLLLLLPLWKTVGLPSARVVSTPVTMGRRAPETLASPPRSGNATIVPSAFDRGRLLQPSRIPDVISTDREPSPQPPGGGDVALVGTGLSSGGGDGLPISLFSGTRPVLPTPPPPTITRAFRTSSILEGSLIRRVTPTYPPLARTARIQGPVVLFAIISKAGTIDKLRAVSGLPMLVPAAIDAVSQWRYRPYILNNEPIEVETQITVNFLLSGN